jgi:hypothetical protein
MTSDCHQLYLDTRVSNSAGQTGTVRLDSHAILDRLAISYDKEGPGGTVKQRRPSVTLVTDEEIMTRTVMLTCGDRGKHNQGTRTPPLLFAGPVGPACGGKGDATSGVPTPSLLSIFCLFFFFSPSRSCTLVLSLKL